MFLITVDGSRPLRPAPWRSALLAGLADGLAVEHGRGLRVPSVAPILGRLLNDPSEQVRDAAFEVAPYFHLPGMIHDALAAAASDDLSLERRERAVRFLRGGDFSDVAPVLGKILDSPSPRELQAAAVDTLSEFDDSAVPGLLLSGWEGYSPASPRQDCRSTASQPQLGRRLAGCGRTGGNRAGGRSTRSPAFASSSTPTPPCAARRPAA